MQSESKKLLWDARTALERISRFVKDKHFTDYCADDLLRSAVERQFEITGEAFAQLRKLDGETAALVPDLPRIIAFRNVLVHGYATVDNQIVWGIIETSLRALRVTVEELLDA